MKRALILLMAFVMPAIGFAKTINVPGDYTNIQDAINAAAGGDTVLVHPGTYVENIDFVGKKICVKSSQGPERTIIDGGNPANPDHGSVVSFKNKEGADSVLEGFTLTGGSGTQVTPFTICGGGIFCDGASPTIRFNIITGNEAYYDGHGGGIYCFNASSLCITGNTIVNNDSNVEGGGIYCKQCSGTIAGNTIHENEAGDWEHGWGGGIFCEQSSVTIENNSIHDNIAHGQGGGGGICCFAGATLIDNNSICGNTAWATWGYGGGGVYGTDFTITNNDISGNLSGQHGGGIAGSGAIGNNTISDNIAGGYGGGIDGGTTITGNLIIKNSASDGGGIVSDGEIKNNMVIGNSADTGGGMYFGGPSTITLINNTIHGNQANNKGGGIYCWSSTIDMPNTILWNNSAPAGPEIWMGITSNPSTINISYSDVDGGQPSVYVDPGCTLNWGAGMIDADPLFVTPVTGDCHLTYLSPCKDAGDNGVAGLPTLDFEGDPRIAASTVDMGADEFHRHLYYKGDASPGSQVGLHFVGMPGDPVLFFVGSGVLDPPLSTIYGDWYLKFPLPFQSAFGIIPSDGVASFLLWIASNAPSPWDIPMQAGIGMKLTNLCVMKVR